MNEKLYQVSYAELAIARSQAHQVCQWVTRAARANLVTRDDDGHSNFGWLARIQGFVSRPLDDDKRFQAGFSFDDGTLVWCEEGRVSDTMAIWHAEDEALGVWLNRKLENAGLNLTSGAEMPYQLDDTVAYTRCESAMQALGLWFETGFVALESLSDKFAPQVHSTSETRCWPHHFDVGMLLLLDQANPEEARSVGLGLSPGDSSYEHPYFYCSPWPIPDTTQLGDAPERLVWHTQGFTSLIATADAVRDVEDPQSLLSQAAAQCINILQG